MNYALHAARLAVCLAFTFAATQSAAFPAIYNLWNDLYPEATADDELTATQGTPCQMCHVNPGGGSPWNSYGYSILANGGFANLPQAFFDAENEDADGEGNTNLQEILGGALPGWCETDRPGCQNLGFTRDGIAQSATPPANVTLDLPMSVPPVANAGGPYEGLAGLRMTFDGSGSSDADGNLVAWDWKFGRGGQAAGPRTAYVFASPGTYTVYLRVTDNDGLRDYGTATVIVREPFVPAPPIADAGGPYEGFVGQTLMFDGSASSDADSNITSWLWQFGDGASGTGAMPVHQYAAPGVYEVSLTVTDNDGLSASAQTSAVVTLPPDPGEQIFRAVCEVCHGDPWTGPPVDPSLVAGRRNSGARTCSIQGAINGTFVFPGGVPEMQFLQGVYTAAQIEDVSAFLNSRPLSGRQRFVTTCAGCHGNDASGGRVGEDVRGRDADRIRRALAEVPQMGFINCLPNTDIELIGGYLETLDDG